MMLKKLLINFFIILFITACSPDGGTSNNTYKFFVFKDFFTELDDSIVLEYKYNFSDAVKYIKLNTGNNKWEATSKNVANPISQEVISFVNNKTIVKDENGTIVFELTPPTIQNIENSTGVNLPNSMAYYNLFKSGKKYKWDRKTYIVNVGIEKAKRDNNSDSYTFTEVHCFSLVFDDINDSWSIVYIGKRPDIVNGFDYYEDDLNLYFTNKYRKFIDGNISLCHNWAVSKDERCFIKNIDGTLELKKLYGEILPIEYKIVLDELYDRKTFRVPAPSLYFFDTKYNLNVFYNDVDNAKGKYFKYLMYAKENPTILLHEQKIEWKK